MEAGALLTLRDHAETAKDYAEMQSKLSQHADATRRHAELIEGCIERLGSRPSALKEVVGSALGKVTGLANLPAKDTVVKNALGDYAAENFEIACYTSLIAAAEMVVDQETADVCRQILHDEEEMSSWLKAYIPTLTQTFLAGQTDDEGDSEGMLGGVGQKVAGLGKKTQEVAANVDSKNALLTSGALLLGAGAALLVGQALRGGGETKEEQADEDPSEDLSVTDAYDALQADYAGAEVIEVRVEAESFGDVQTDYALAEVVEVESFGKPLESAGLPEVDSGEMPIYDETVITDLASLDEMDAEMPVYTEVWLVPGPYSGLGPKGYNDAGDPTGQEVASRLTQHGQVDASNIEITIDNGEVLLEGTVDSEETKRLAQEALESIVSVGSVQNLLQVQTDQADPDAEQEL